MKIGHDAVLFLKITLNNRRKTSSTLSNSDVFTFLVTSMLEYVAVSKKNTVISNHISANSGNSCEFCFEDGSSVVLCKDGNFWAKVKLDPQKTREPSFDHLSSAELLRVVDRDGNKEVVALAHRLENMLKKYDDVFYKMVELDIILDSIKFERV